MRVILESDVANLGEEGDIVEVKRGYARNFLIPQGFANLCSKGALASLAQRQGAIKKRKEEKRAEAKSLKDKLSDLVVELKVTVGDTGKLFGSINNSTVADELAKLGFAIERKKIELSEHTIKMVGSYTAKIRLYENEVAVIKVVVSDIKAKKEESEEK